jgi:hypothetical protein
MRFLLRKLKKLNDFVSFFHGANHNKTFDQTIICSNSDFNQSDVTTNRFLITSVTLQIRKIYSELLYLTLTQAVVIIRFV